MKIVYGTYLVLGTAFAVYMLTKHDEAGDCVSQMGQYEMVSQSTSPYDHNNAHFIAVEYAAAVEACKATPNVVSKPAPIVAADAARQATKDKALALLKERYESKN